MSCGRKNGCMWKAASPLVLPTRPFQPAWLVPNLVVWTVLIRCPYASCIVQLETIVNARPRSDCRRQRKSWEHGPWSLCRLLPLNWYVAAPNSVIMHCEVEAQKSAMAYKHHQEAKTKGAEINADTINKALGGEYMSIHVHSLSVRRCERSETCPGFLLSNLSTRLVRCHCAEC